VEEVRVECICLGRDVALKAVAALKEWVRFEGWAGLVRLTRTGHIRTRSRFMRCIRWKTCEVRYCSVLRKTA